MITESVEIPRPLREAYERWTRDETIPAAMRRAEHPTEGDPGGDGAEIAWSERNDAPGRTGRVTFAAASERSTTITVELEPEPESEGGGDAGPRARGLLDRFRDSFPAAAGDPGTALGGSGGAAGTEPAPDAAGNQAPPPPGDVEDADLTKRRHVPGLPSNR
jgi:hypothetical protein